MTERRFDEGEVALILKRAAESNAVTLGTRADGLTLPQLRQVASEAGIDPAAVDQAAHALDSRVAQSVSPLLGTPLSPQYEQVVAGRLTDEDLPDLVLAIRRVMGRQGVVERDLGGFQWRARDAMGGRYITIHVEGERTLIRAMGNFRDGAMVSSMLAGMAGVVTSLIVLKTSGLLSTLGVLNAPILAAAALLPARIFWRRAFGREDRRLREAVAEAASAAARRLAGRTRDPDHLISAVDEKR
ncbi:MAG: hypothetical protein ABI910_21655 [Gemmatimonadota bacterium]